MANKLIILDRDGVINHDPHGYIQAPEQWHAIAGSLEAIARLCRENYRVVVITNQSGIARGYFSLNALNRIHQKMRDELQHFGGEINAIFFCPHRDEEQCACRKPKPGMFLELARRLQCELDDVYAIGDSLRDLQAATAAGARPILVESGDGQVTADQLEQTTPPLRETPRFADLRTFVDHLL